jgi:hypothetical protein
MSNRIDTNVLRPRVDPQVDGPPTGAGEGAAVSDRTVRSLADSRLDEFFEGGSARTGIQCDFKEHHDFALCGMEAVPNPVLFAWQSNDVDAVDPNDVMQRSFQDCHLMAALVAMASTPDGRAAIKGMMRESTNAKGEVSYTVTLHVPERHFLGLAQTTYTEVPIKVEGPFPKGHAGARDYGISQEMWPIVMEQAFAKLYGGYEQINRGRSPALALEVLTGKPVESFGFGWLSSFGPSDLAAALSAGKLVVLRTSSSLPCNNTAQLVREHAYAVIGIDMVEGRPYLRLQNPWGFVHSPPIAVDEMRRWFSGADVGSVR